MLGVLAALVMAALWFGAFYAIMWCQESRFRYRLWHLRDRIVADVLAEDLPAAPAVQHLLEDIEIGIRHTPRIRLSRLLAFGLAHRGLDIPGEGPATKGKLTASQRAQLRAYEDELARAYATYLLTGAPVGWLAVAWTLPGIILDKLRHRRSASAARTSTAAAAVPADLARHPEAWIRSSKRDKNEDEPLSACV